MGDGCKSGGADERIACHAPSIQRSPQKTRGGHLSSITPKCSVSCERQLGKTQGLGDPRRTKLSHKFAELLFSVANDAQITKHAPSTFKPPVLFGGGVASILTFLCQNLSI